MNGQAHDYDFGNKRHYRRTIWSYFAKHAGPVKKGSTALLMPGINGEEINVATQKGFSQANLCAVDRNPAVVATLKRRFPLLRTYGVDVGRAAGRIAEEGIRIQYANLDLCSPVGFGMLNVIHDLARSGCLDHLALVAINTLRGRENGELLPWWEDRFNRSDGPFASLPNRDQSRLQILQHALSASGMKDGVPLYLPFALRCGMYRSNAGTQTMLWAIYQVHRQPCPCGVCSLIQDGIPRMLTESADLDLDVRHLDALQIALKTVAWGPVA